MSNGPGSTSVALATDDSFVGDGLASQLAGVGSVDVVGRTRNYLDLFDMVENLRPQAVIISTRSTFGATMPTIVVARQLRQEFLQLGIVIISGHDEACVLEAIRDGASRMAFLLDERLLDLTTVLNALHEVCAGQSVLDPSIVDSLVSHYEGVPVNILSSREPEVLEQMAKGLSNRAIASELNISVKAIEKDVTAIFRKLELVDRTLIDRRVTASLAFLRTLTNPFGSDDRDQPRSTHIVVEPEAGRTLERHRPHHGEPGIGSAATYSVSAAPSSSSSSAESPATSTSEAGRRP